MFFAALLVYFFWKYAPSTPELEEGELEDSDEDENNMFFSNPLKESFHFMHSDSENVFLKDLNSSRVLLHQIQFLLLLFLLAEIQDPCVMSNGFWGLKFLMQIH